MKIDKKLVGYVAAAAAGSLVVSDRAEADIVVRSGSPIGAGGIVDLDFNQSTPAEFRVQQQSGPNRVSLVKDEVAYPFPPGNSQAYLVDPNTFPAALAAGTPIGLGGSFASTYPGVLGTAGDPAAGNFLVDDIVGNTQYVGVRFTFPSDATLYYGWIGVDFTSSVNATGLITGYGYDTTGAAINAGQGVPEPTGLALLALGAPYLLRRKRD